MKKFLLGLLVLVLGIGALGAFMVTSGNLKKLTEQWLSTQLNRAIAVDGEFTAELGVPLRLTATSVRLANPDWTGTPDMATAAYIEAAIDPWTILGDAPLILEELTIRKLKSDFVRDEKGQSNWDFTRDATTSSGANFLIRQLQVSDAGLSLQRPGFNKVSLVIDKLVQTENSDGLLDLSISGKLGDRTLNAKGEIGPFKNILDATDVRFALRADIGKLKINGLGRIDDLAEPRQPEFSLTIDAPDAGEVASMAGLDLDASGDVKLEFQVIPSESGVQVSAGGRWGGNNLNVKGNITDLTELDGLKLVASGDGPNLRTAIGLFGYQGLPEQAFKFSGDVSRQDKQLDIQELDLTIGQFLFQLKGEMQRFPSLRDSNLELSVKGEDAARFREVFGLPGVAKGEFGLEGELGRGPAGKDEFRLRVRTELGKGTVVGTLGTGKNYAGTKARLRGDGKNLNRFGELLGLPGLKDEPFKLKFDVVSLDTGGFQLNPGSGLMATDTKFLMAGTLGAEPLKSGTQLDWELDGLDIKNLVDAAGLTWDFPSRPIKASGKVQIRPDDFVLSGVSGTIGKADFSLSGQIGRAESFRGSDLRLEVKGPDLERLAFLVANVNLPAGPFQIAGRLQRTPTGIRVSDSSISIAGAAGKADGEVSLPIDPLTAEFDIEIQGPDISAFWESRYDVAFGKQAFNIDARGKLSDETWDIQDGDLTIGQANAKIAGTIRKGSGSIKINVTSPEVGTIGTLYGVPLFPNRALQLSGVLERKNNMVQLSNFLAKTNKGDLAGQISYTQGTPPRIDADLTSKNLDIIWVTEPIEKQLDQKAKSAKKETRPDKRLIPEWDLPMAALKKYDLDISISADEIIRENRDIRNAYLHVIVEDGSLRVAPWQFSGESGSLDAEMQVVPLTDGVEGADVTLRLDAKDLVSEIFVTGQDVLDFNLLPKSDWTVNLTSRGKSLRALFGNLDGQVKLSSSSGKIVNSATKSVIFGDLIGNITSAVNPDKNKQTYTNVRCAVFPFNFDNGEMETTPSIVVQTDKLNILSRGSIDLKNERLDLSFTSKPRTGIGISAGSVVNPFVRIGGTMADPRITLDATGAALSTGAAVLTMGLSVLAKAAFDAAWRSPDPCGRVTEEAEKRFAKANSKKKKE